MADQHDATFYVQLEPSGWYGFNRDTGEPRLSGIKAVRMTQSKPERQIPGTVLVKLTVRAPEAAFLPLRPEAIVVIPEDMTRTEPIQIEAVDPGREE